MTRRFPDRPIVGVGAVVLDADNRVLLVKRGHAPLQGEWSLPGGAVETGETLEGALRRELLEETGLSVEVGPVVEVLDRIERTPDGRVEYHFVIIDYVCYASGDAPVCASDADEGRWVPRDELATYNVTEKATSVIDQALSVAASTGNRRGLRAER
jgi:mutator protein MutT